MDRPNVCNGASHIHNNRGVYKQRTDRPKLRCSTKEECWKRPPRHIYSQEGARISRQRAMIERLYDVGHKLVVSALLGTSAIGMTYIGFAGVDVYGRWKKHKALKQEQKQD